MSMKRQWNNDRNESRLQSFLEVKKYRGGIHGLSHAQRVEKFGLMLAEKTDADRDVIIWFAYLHDSQRTDDGIDFNHGPDAARFVDTIRNAFLQELSDTQIIKLKEACRLHTSTHRTGDITVDTCFDADRLDLPRVGVMPDPKRMATEQGAKYAGRGYNDNCDEAGCNKKTNLQFHDQIINTGKGESKFAVRFNVKTDDGKSISPFTYSKLMKHYNEWDLNAKSVSCDGIRGLDMATGIYAVDFDTFISGKGLYAKFIKMKNKNATLFLLEYNEDDVVLQREDEICFSQCNIVYVSDQSTFMARCEDGTLRELMAQFVIEKESAGYNTYAKPIRSIQPGISKFVKDFNVNKLRIFIQNHVAMLNNLEHLGMPIPVINWGVLIKLCALDSLNFSVFAKLARTSYMKNLQDEEIEMLISIFNKDVYKDELTEARLKAFNDAEIIYTYLFTGKDESKSMFYKTSKKVFNDIIKPLRKMAKEQAQIICNTKFKNQLNAIEPTYLNDK